MTTSSKPLSMTTMEDAANTHARPSELRITDIRIATGGAGSRHRDRREGSG